MGLPRQILNPDLLAEGLLVSDLPPWLALLAPGLRVHPGRPPLFASRPHAQPGPLPRLLFNRLILPELLISLVWAFVEDQATFPTPTLLLERLLRRLIKHARLRRRAPPPVPDSGPSSIPSPSHPVATASPSPPIATPPPISSQADASPDPSVVPVEPPTTQPSPPAHPPTQPSTSQQHQSTKADPSHRSPPVTSPPEPSPVPPSAPSVSVAGPSGSTAGPSGSATGPSQPPPPVPQFYRTTAPSEVGLQSRHDVSTSFLIMKGRLANLWEESMHQMELLPPLAQMERFSELYIKACAESLAINQSFHAVHHQNKMLQDKVTKLELQLNNLAQASHALRTEVKELTKGKNSLELSLAISNHELRGLQEEKSQVEVMHQQ
ncbi:ras-associated and pleckstrin homology domains-containing protein 1-like [Zingiber officinale]|uniref:ras-associated and pleckstrin homology domains-containing protein 1-like n=1 Tax=Zingiber officinale TaxID=94328 RepID=UPI001C4CB1F6|nr:ras-associated and pleckstrin homology domains-containing protein 1-like [Zingiber officinale]